MSTVVKDKDKVRVYCKGAPKYVLKNCTHYLDASENVVKLNGIFFETLQNKMK